MVVYTLFTSLLPFKKKTVTSLTVAFWVSIAGSISPGTSALEPAPEPFKVRETRAASPLPISPPLSITSSVCEQLTNAAIAHIDKNRFFTFIL
ncbi:hypothetical protein [Coprobacter tertius]|uniref:Secreted protein n=1 Tax=Coprobacter tertius TaxID=2944915 RepID=A0ABT1MH52_9BACT|nr:hypothetical protein [Coprobacter tertius]MCP9611379.1 hypothetical protein [Coprobacter tertius]